MQKKKKEKKYRLRHAVCELLLTWIIPPCKPEQDEIRAESSRQDLGEARRHGFWKLMMCIFLAVTFRFPGAFIHLLFVSIHMKSPVLIPLSVFLF